MLAGVEEKSRKSVGRRIWMEGNTHELLSSRFLRVLNCIPCNGLVSTSASISFVDLYSISISFIFILSVRKKYLIFTCLVFSLLDRPLFINCIVDLFIVLINYRRFHFVPLFRHKIAYPYYLIRRVA